MGKKYGPTPEKTPLLEMHGSTVAAYLVGRNLGIADKATMVVYEQPGGGFLDPRYPLEKYLDRLVWAADHIKTTGRQGKAVVNICFGHDPRFLPAPYADAMGKFSSHTSKSPSGREGGT